MMMMMMVMIVEDAGSWLMTVTFLTTSYCPSDFGVGTVEFHVVEQEPNLTSSPLSKPMEGPRPAYNQDF